MACVYQLVQFSKSLPSPHLTNEETKAQRLRNPEGPSYRLPTVISLRQSGSRARAPNRTLLVLEAPSLHPLSGQSVQDEPGGDSANAWSLVRAEAEVEMTHLCRPCGVLWSLTEQCFILVSHSLFSLYRTSPRLSIHSTRGPSLTSGLLTQRLPSSLLPLPHLDLF